MKRCTECFRYSFGTPTFCAYCGRSYQIRLCPRGHKSPRNVTFCTECGSSDLSTAAPPATLWFRLSELAIRLGAAVVPAIVIAAVLIALLTTINWSGLGAPLATLAVLLGLAYWATTLLPAPVRRIGRAVGRRAARAMRNKARRQ